jgi:predicted transposase YbfD/YdcC
MMLRQDNARTRCGNAASNISTLRPITLNVLNLPP